MKAQGKLRQTVTVKETRQGSGTDASVNRENVPGVVSLVQSSVAKADSWAGNSL